MMARLNRAAVLAAILLLCVADSASARHARSNGGEPGDFSYFVLSLSWSPAYCLDSPGAGECSGPRRYGFIVHGLWPQNDSGGPEYCNVHVSVPEDVVQNLAEIMPARGLVYHEWSAHGTCSGLDPIAYFGLLRRAYAGVVIPTELTTPNAPIERPPGVIANAFARANRTMPIDSLVVTCSGQGAPRLREVRLCLARDLTPRGCSAGVLRSACRAAQVIIPPIR